MHEYGRLPNPSVFQLPECGGRRAISVAAARVLIEDYEKDKATIPAHREDDVALVIGPMGQVAWYLLIPEPTDYIGKHRKSVT